jgi:hypothetical protein
MDGKYILAGTIGDTWEIDTNPPHLGMKKAWTCLHGSRRRRVIDALYATATLASEITLLTRAIAKNIGQ